MKIVFLGTPEIATKTLQVLNIIPDIEISAVITQPDKPAGRKKTLSPPQIKTEAKKLNLKIFQPRDKTELTNILKKFRDADFFIVFAFGMILPEEVLKIPKFGAINIHTSLLPKYRGASPIQSALLNNDKETGISIIKMNKKMDQGGVFIVKRCDIETSDTYKTLSEKLSAISAALLPPTLYDIMEGFLTPIPQSSEKATYCKKIEKKDGEICFKKSAKEIKNMLRAYTPWPGIFTKFKDKKLEILEMNIDEKEKLQEGEFKIEGKTLKIGTSKGAIIPKKVKPEGKKEMDIKSFLNGLN